MVHLWRDFYRRHERWLPAAFFILGFIFDAVVLRRPDEGLVIAQQAVYLALSAGLIAIELSELARGPLAPPRWLKNVWEYREAALHFLMGTLLNAYTIFFFKSASALTSLALIAVLALVLVINEFKRFGRFQTQVHMGIWSLCLICFAVSLAPLVWGFIGAVPFVSANFAAFALMLVYRALVRRKVRERPEILGTHLLLPFAAVQIVFICLYALRVLPPVPLSASYMGIYHNVEKVPGGYRLTYTRPDEFFWQNGDQTFLYRPGDSIYCFVRIFAPAGFKDELRVRWLFDDPSRGWQAFDAIPLPILGGREEGYRGYTKKSNFQPGRWRVQVETPDGHEIGRITLRVIEEDLLELRREKYQIQ